MVIFHSYVSLPEGNQPIERFTLRNRPSETRRLGPHPHGADQGAPSEDQGWGCLILGGWDENFPFNYRLYIYIHFNKAELQLLGIFNLHCTLAIDLFVSIGWDIYIYVYI